MAEIRVTPDEIAELPPEGEVEATEDGTGGIRVTEQQKPATEETEETPAAQDFGGFPSPEKLAEAYQNLRKAYSQGKRGNPDEVVAPAAKTEETQEAPEGAEATTEQQVEQAGLNMDEFVGEFMQKGELSEESYTKLQKAGFDKRVVDQYIEGRQAVVEQLTTAMATEVGGQETLTAMLQWAQANLSAEEIAEYNNAVDSGQKGRTRIAVRGLHSLYQEASGKSPRLLTGENRKANGGVTPFKSNAEIVRAMSDPRYDKDPAYRAEVDQRLMLSDA